MFHSRRSIKRPGSSLSDQFYKKIKRVNSRWCVDSFYPPPSIRTAGRERVREPKRGGCSSISTSLYLIEQAQRQREGRCLNVFWTLPEARRREGVCLCPSRAGNWSWGFLGVAGVCVLGCGAWAVCHSDWGCDCCGEGRKGSGRSQLPFHWVPAGHSLLALKELQGKKERKTREKFEKNAKAKSKRERRGACNSSRFLSSSIQSLHKLTVWGHDQIGHELQDPAVSHTPRQQRTHQHHRHSWLRCSGGWRCLQRAPHGGRVTSSPHSCSLYACKLQAPEDPWWWHMDFHHSGSRSCCYTWRP